MGKGDTMQEGSFVGHTACVDCDSSDGLAVYRKEDSDGVIFEDGYCFACEGYFSPKKLGSDYEFIDNSSTGVNADVATVESIKEYDTRGVKARRIKKTFCEMYGMKVSYNEEDGSIDTYYNPVHKEGEITGWEVRELPKTFRAIGDTKKCELFGQHLFSGSGEYANRVSNKFLIICEGRLDTIAMQQAMVENGNGNFINAVVGLPNGANAKSVKVNYKFVNGFQSVILVMDQDDPGKKAAFDIAKSLPMGKAKIASYSEKDPCDMLRKGKGSELSKLIWKAEPYSPSGIISGEGLWELVSESVEDNSIPYAFKGLNEKLDGIRTSELVTMVAGTGVSKSTFARAFMHHILKTTNENVAGMFLEESVRKTGLSLMSMDANKLLHLPEHGASQDEMRESFEGTLGTGRVFLYDSFGSNDIDTICENITYFARVADCKYIFLDHISILVSGGVHGDERRALDEISTKIRTLVQELDVCLFMVCHLKRPEGLGHEQGRATELSQLRGSAGIAQLSDTVIGFERNSQADDDKERNTSTIRVLKNRHSGNTGIAAKVIYNPVTGEMTEIDKGDKGDGGDGTDGGFEDIPWDG